MYLGAVGTGNKPSWCASRFSNANRCKNSMNNRANIMYFIEHLCDMSQKENHPDFVRMMQRDILRVVDAVAPSDGSGAANVKVVRRVSGYDRRLATSIGKG